MLNEILDIILSEENALTLLKIAIVFIVVLVVALVAFICYSKKVKNTSIKNAPPEIGETRGAKVYVALDDLLFASDSSQNPIGYVSNYLSNAFEGKADISLGITWYAISRNGRFSIRVPSKGDPSKKTTVWVEPSEYFSTYKVNVKRPEQQQTSPDQDE